MDVHERLRARLDSLVQAAGLNRSQAAYAVGRSPSRLADYLGGRTVPSALVLVALEDAADQAAKRTWMRAADVVDAVAEHAEDDPVWALRMLLQGRDQSRALSTPARQAIWATGAPKRRLTGPWKALTYAVLRDTVTPGRPMPKWLVAPTPLREAWEPLPVRADRPLDESLAKLGIRVNDRELMTA